MTRCVIDNWRLPALLFFFALCFVAGVFAANDIVKVGVIEVNATGMDVRGWMNVTGTVNSTGAMYASGSQVCTAGNGLCAAVGGSGGGWVNDSVATRTQLRVVINNSNSTDGSFFVQNTSGSPHVFVNGSSGYVGIGTGSPTSPLHIVTSNETFFPISPATIRLVGTAPLGASTSIEFNSSGGRVALWQTGGTLFFGDGAGYASTHNVLAVNPSSQTVGVNTETAGHVSTFTVNGNAIIGNVSYWNTGSIPENSLVVQGSIGIGSKSPPAALTVNNSNSTGSLLIQNTSGNTHLFVNGTSGYVGVGGSSPTFPFYVYTATGYPVAQFYSNWAGIDKSLGIFMDASGTILDSSSSLIFDIGSVPKMIIHSSGNVGVGGGFTPSATLQVNSSNTAGSFYVHNTSNSPHLIVNGSSGYVGIGTAAPNTTLDVNGTATVSGIRTPILIGNASGGAYGVDMVIDGRYAYTDSLNAPYNLTVYDINVPSRPFMLSQTAVPHGGRAIAKAGKYVYVGGANLTVIDVSNPKSPIILGTASSGGAIRGIAVSGQYAYVGDWLGGFEVFDVSNPRRPYMVAQRARATMQLQGIAVQGSYAYVGEMSGNANDSLLIYNITTPSNPILVGNVSVGGFAPSVAVQDGIAVIPTYSQNSTVIVNISDPANPVIVRNISTPLAGVKVSINGKYAYVGGASGLQAIDISDPANAYVAINITGQTFERVIASGRYLYGSGENFLVYDIGGVVTPNLEAGQAEIGQLQVRSDANVKGALQAGSLAVGAGGAQVQGDVGMTGGSFRQAAGEPTIIGGINGSGRFDAGFKMQVVGQYAYVNDYNGGGTRDMYIIDISNPRAPRLVGILNNSGIVNGFGVRVAGKYAYVNAYYYGIWVIDVSNPANPTNISNITTSANISASTDLDIEGRYGYIVNFDGSATTSSFTVLDFGNPLSPRVAGYILNTTHLNASIALRVSNGYAYVLSTGQTPGNKQFTIINISNPTAPTILGSIENTSYFGNGGAVEIVGSYAYVTNNINTAGKKNFVIINISDPSAPTIVSGLEDSTALNGSYYFSVQGKYAYIGNYNNASTSAQFAVVDVSDVTSPVIVKTITDRNRLALLNGLAVSGKYAYAVTGAAVSTTQQAFSVIDLGGLDAPGANIGTIATNAISVDGRADIRGQLNVAGGLGVGGTAVINGDLAITGASNCIVVPGGGKLCGNATCTWIVSPNGNTTMQACN